MSNPSELVFSEDIVPAGYELTDEAWEAHMQEIMEIGKEEIADKGEEEKTTNIDMSWAVVFVRIDKEMYHDGPRKLPTDILHVSHPGMYVGVPAGTSNDNTKIETVFPTEDEDEIKRWKLVPCSAQLQLQNSWVRFRCKLLESQGVPEDFEVVKTSPNVVDCKVYRLAHDDNGNHLLWINMKGRRLGKPRTVEMCLKKIVGQEVTSLSHNERSYVFDEECGRLWEEPYVGI